MLAHLRKVNEEQQRLSEGLFSLAPYTHTHPPPSPHPKGQIQLRAANLMLFLDET